MYARGMSVREIQSFLLEMYVIEVSPDFISTVTDTVIGEVREWQQRPLEPMYPVSPDTWGRSTCSYVHSPMLSSR